MSEPRAKVPIAVAKRSPSAERRSAATHQAVIEAASQLLIERGYASVTIEQIAALAGVGKQTIYRWWSSKIEIYIELYDGIAQKNIKPIEGKSLEEEVALYANGLLKQLSHPVAGMAFKGMVAEAQASEKSSVRFRDYMLKRFSITRGILERAKKRKEIAPDVDVDALSSLVGGAVVWRLLLGDRKLERTFISEICAIVTRGLRYGRLR